VSELPHSRPAVEVTAEYLDGDIHLTPKVIRHVPRMPEIQESGLDQLSHQLLEEPDETGLEIRRINGVEIEARSERFSEIERRSPREALVWYQCTPELAGAVLGDRIDVLKDIMESSYSCKPCHGKGHTE